ncbi:fibronectin type III domain-containing protein 11-like [Seriola aureovittata]|uniref:fibronectin type III domain-containing protein 11-like n=1 Tax=Seriola aureovittata TaxID=2871759 RepID=UPI0024BE0B2E|nr:fibronectin type III domain-containing protein 11-like [Seriola aureovittata]
MNATVSMDEVKPDCPGSGGCGAQEVRGQTDISPDIRDQILQLFCTRLSDNSVMVMQKELQLMHRGSYYLEIQREDLLPSADQQQQQHTLHLSDSTVWSLIDQQRLQGAMTMAKTQVKLLLTFLEMLHQEIMRGGRELEDFIVKYNQGLVDATTAASMQQKLQQTHQDLGDFERRMTQTLGPLNLHNQLIPNTGNFPVPQLSVTVAMKMPVIFDRFRTRVTSTSVYLYWEVTGEQPKEPNQQFEIHVKSIHPTINDHGQFSKCMSRSYNIQVNDLISDRYYQFSVKRVDAINLVYGMWIDTITLKTLDVSK